MKRLKLACVLLSCLLPFSALGKGVYMTPEAFLAESFPSTPPQIESLWLRDEIRDAAKQILNHAYPGMRIRYWRSGEGANQRSAWIMNEVGKTRPITIGIVIVGDHIERVRILEFRESRGAEVRMAFFTRQFVGLSLQTDKHQLSGNIDGITGATLSVKAVKKTARFALFLHQLVINEGLADAEQAVQQP
ncbi:MAG: FMN-binding protein [Cellvibrionales bacterium]|nr:MAG: FMN-binding protein [Cellvibrionales bacterium]